jgi:hypothetical protein
VLEVELRSVVGAGGPMTQRDRLTFLDGKLVSKSLTEQGFLPAAYTVEYRDGVAAWQAMQTNATGWTIQWQGEWDGRTMHGMFIRQAPGAAPAHFTFVGETRQEPSEQGDLT